MMAAKIGTVSTSCYVVCVVQTNLTRTLIDKQDMDEIDILNGLRQIDVSMTCVFLSFSVSHEFDTIKNVICHST